MQDDQLEFSSEDDKAGSDLNIRDFGQAVLWGTDWTVETILAQLRRGNIEINPRFQRRDAWSRLNKSRFVESIILGLPIPQVVLAEIREQRGKYIILDGKQRLLSLMQFAGIASGDNNNFSLSGLEVRHDLTRKKFRNFEKNNELSSDLNAFLTHTIRAIVIRNWPSLSFLHIVFQRLNTGSLKLSPQELRQALAPGDFINFVDDATIQPNEIHSLLGRTMPDPRMRDIELLVRFLGFQMFLREYKGRMKEFLDKVCIDLNRDWNQKKNQVERETENFKAAITALEEIFGKDKVARKLKSRLFNRSIFDALAYYAANPEIREAMVAQQEEVRTRYEALIRDSEFQEAVESDTAGIPHTAVRLQKWGVELSNILRMKIVVPKIKENENDELRFVA